MAVPGTTDVKGSVEGSSLFRKGIYAPLTRLEGCSHFRQKPGLRQIEPVHCFLEYAGGLRVGEKRRRKSDHRFQAKGP